MFKWAIFNNEQDAVNLKDACNVLSAGEVEYRGAPPHVPPTATDYTYVIRHHQQPLWAVPLDEQAQQLLYTTVTLGDPDPSWFPGPHIG